MTRADAAAHLGSLSVVIPAYNAARHVGPTLEAVQSYLRSCGLTHEIILVDDGSQDDTAALAAAHPGVRVLRNGRNRGKGAAVRRGILAARMAWVLFMDVDHSTRIENLGRFAAERQRADVIIASRRLAGSRIVRRQPTVRQALGRTFPYLVRVLALPHLRDTQCGFKLFRGDAAAAIFRRQQVRRFAFDVEALLRARRLRRRVIEVPIDWDNPTDSTLRAGRDSLRMLADLLRVALGPA